MATHTITWRILPKKSEKIIIRTPSTVKITDSIIDTILDLLKDLDVINDHMQKRVNGSVEVRLHKGSMKVITKKSCCALYNEETVSFDDKESIDQREMIGMVKYHDIQGAEYKKVCRKN